MTRHRVAGIATVLLVLAVLPLGTYLFLKKGEEVRGSRKIPEFELTAADGSSFHSSELKGKTYVAEFTFSSCRSPRCHKLDSLMRALQDRFGWSDDFRQLTFTIDPQDDLPALTAMAAERDAGKGWYHLTGPVDTLERLILGGFFAKPDPGKGNRDKMSADKELCLVDSNGIIKGYYDALDKEETDLLFETIDAAIRGTP
jgi:protein SCO1/2